MNVYYNPIVIEKKIYPEPVERNSTVSDNLSKNLKGPAQDIVECTQSKLVINQKMY